MPLTSPGNDDDTGENHQPTLRKNTAEPVEQTLKQNKQSQAGHRLPARTLRRRCELMWSLWPPVPLVDEVHHVVHVDGIHLHRDAVVLIAVAGGHVIGWHVAKSEKAAAWQCLMARIAPPDVLVCDGGGGVLKAAKAMWPDTRIQRCLFHVQANILEPAGRRPRLEAGGRLRRVALSLPRVGDAGGSSSSPARAAASVRPSCSAGTPPRNRKNKENACNCLNPKKIHD